MNKKFCDILIVGVGGQGTLLASRVLGKYALDEGYDVKLSEVHGMAQRGGIFTSHRLFFGVDLAFLSVGLHYALGNDRVGDC